MTLTRCSAVFLLLSSMTEPCPGFTTTPRWMQAQSSSARYTHSSFLSSPYFMSREERAAMDTSLASMESALLAPSFVQRIDKMPLDDLAIMLDKDLYESQWFVTGKVNPKYFAEDFTYEDADVELSSLDDYINDVQALFDQKVSKAEIMSTEVNPDLENTITCTWRLSGRANLGWGFYIKPCLVYTDFYINPETGLIQHQEDRYSIRHWDIFLSALFPHLEGRLTAAKAPPVPARIDTPNHHRVFPVEAWVAKSGVVSYFCAPKQTKPSSQQYYYYTDEEIDDTAASASSELYAYSDMEKLAGGDDAAVRKDDAKKSDDDAPLYRSLSNDILHLIGKSKNSTFFSS